MGSDRVFFAAPGSAG